MKKIVSVIFILFGAMFCLSLLVQLPILIGIITQGLYSDDAYDVGVMIGTILGFVIISMLAYFSIKYGLRWVRNPKSQKVIEDVLDEHLMTNQRNENL